MCKEAGVAVMAISDHNCVKANEAAEKEASAQGVKYIPATEIDCTYKGLNFHLLGYQINYKSPDFDKIENNIASQEITASHKRLELTRGLGFEISEGELRKLSDAGYWKGIWTGEMFAELLLNNPEYKDNELLLPYREGGVRSANPFVNFYWDFYAQGKPCYAEMVFPSLEEAIAVIKDNGGKAVLAHPGMNLKNNFGLFDEIVKLGIDGVEAFSSYHSKEDNEYFYNAAQKYSLIATCGSDFHGKIKPAIHLGESGCFLDDSELNEMVNRII
jgi:predicted metal-dependent phosphoesterase TrpH